MDLSIMMLIIIAITIIIGFATNINTGLIAMGFSYIIGCFVLGLKPAAIQAFWPVKIFFILFSVSFFYNYSTNNGTMDKFAKLLLFKFGKSAKAFPFVIFVIGWVLSAAGAGAYSIVALLAPITFIVADSVGMNKFLAGMAVYFGAVGGSPWPTSSTGATQAMIIASSGYEAQATLYGIYNTIGTTIFFTLSLVILYFLYKGHKVNVNEIKIEKPEPFTEQQKKSLVLIAAFVIILLVPFLFGMLFPNNNLFKLLQKYNDVAFTAIVLSIIASLLKVGDEKKALSTVPWNTIVMICGIGILVSVAVEAGTIEMITNEVSNVESKFLVPLIMSFGAGIMSIFSSTTGVVLPTLYPTVSAISSATGVNPIALLVGIFMGSVATGMSPFSACGGILIGCVEEKNVQYMFKRLLAIPFALLVFAVLLTAASVIFIF